MSDWDITEEEWPEPDGPALGDPTVLIVDDDPSIRTMLAFVFADEGFDVQEAVDGAEAIEVLGDDPPDVMVLDLMMPNVAGHGVLRARNSTELAPSTRVVILTAKSDASDAVWCWRLGADEYVNKPVDPDVLLREVRALLARTPEENRARREQGLAEAERLDAMESAFTVRRRR